MDDGLTGRLRETVDGFGHLVTEHVQRSKLELLLGGRTLARVAALALGAVCVALAKGRLDRSRLLEAHTGEVGRSLLALTAAAPGRVTG